MPGGQIYSFSDSYNISERNNDERGDGAALLNYTFARRSSAPDPHYEPCSPRFEPALRQLSEGEEHDEMQAQSLGHSSGYKDKSSKRRGKKHN